MEQIQKDLIKLLKSTPRGLSTTDLTRLLNESDISISRVSVRKYLLELFGRGLVQRDKVGVAKVWYLADKTKKDIPSIDLDEWKIIDKIFTFLEKQDKQQSIQEIADELSLNRNTTANNLRVMAQLGMIEESGQGRNRIWQMAVPKKLSRPIFSQLSVVLTELKSSTKSNTLNFHVVSMNSITRTLAQLKSHSKDTITLRELEYAIFQRPVLDPLLLSKVQPHIVFTGDSPKIKLSDLSKKIKLPRIIPKLELDGVSYWKASARLELGPESSADENPQYIVSYLDITPRFHIQQLIWRNSTSFQFFFQSIPVPIVLLTPEFQVIEGNDEFKKLIGSPEQFWGYHCFSLFRGKSQLCDDCPIIQNNLTRDFITDESSLSAVGKELIYNLGESPGFREFDMKIIVNYEVKTRKVTSYFLVLIPKKITE